MVEVSVEKSDVKRSGVKKMRGRRCACMAKARFDRNLQRPEQQKRRHRPMELHETITAGLEQTARARANAGIALASATSATREAWVRP